MAVVLLSSHHIVQEITEFVYVYATGDRGQGTGDRGQGTGDREQEAGKN
ncbi:hypothetical protein [Anabaena sp. CCY 9402-a]